MHTSKCLDVFLSVGVWSTCELVMRCVCGGGGSFWFITYLVKNHHSNISKMSY